MGTIRKRMLFKPGDQIVCILHQEKWSGIKNVIDKKALGTHDSWERVMFGYFCGLHIVIIFVQDQIDYKVILYFCHSS